MSWQPMAMPPPPTLMERYLAILLAIEATGEPLLPGEHDSLVAGLEVLKADPAAHIRPSPLGTPPVPSR